jgi:AraC-like DNA-binding protein
MAMTTGDQLADVSCIHRLSQPVVELRHYRGDHGAHVHDHAQVLFGRMGCLEVEVNGHLMRVDAAAGLVVPAGVSHGSATARGAQVWVVDAPAAAGLERVRAFALPVGLPDRADPSMWLACAGAASRRLPRRALDEDALRQRVSARLHEDWPNERMAAVCALSVPQFSARWRELTGQSPQAWLRALRLNRAWQALQRGSLADDVAAQVGYASASALLFALRRERGLGARDARRR